MPNRIKQDLCHGPLFSQMLLYALPIMATGILQVLYNAADTVVIGQFAGDESLAAVSCTGSLTALIVNLFLGISNGVLTVVARHIGAQHHKRVHQAVHTSLLLSLILGVFLLAVGIPIVGPLLKLMGTGAEGSGVLTKATLYLRIFFLGMPGNMVYNFGAAVLRAAGDPKRPLLYLSVSGIANVALNLVFVIVFHMDVAGVALATIISQYLSAVLVVRCLLRETGDVRLELSQLRLFPKRVKEILYIGIPSGIQSSLFAVSNVLIQSTINSFGELYMAGSGAAQQLESICYTAMHAFYTTTMAFTGQNFGAQNKGRIRRTLQYGHLLSSSVSVTIGLFLVLFRTPLLRVFTSSPEALQAGSERLLIITLTYFMCGAMDVQSSHLRGLGASVVPMFTSLISICGLRIVWIYLVFPLLGRTWQALFLSYPISWIIALTAHLLCSVIVHRRLYRRMPDTPPLIPADTASL